MERNLRHPHLHEILIGTANKTESARIARMVKRGEARKISARLYTTNVEDTLENIVNRNWYHIISSLYPNAVLSHRSAIEGRPVNGHIFFSYSYTKNIQLPGLTLHIIKGPDQTIGAQLFIQNLFRATDARAFLENLQTTHGTSKVPKALDRTTIEERLETIIRTKGEDALNKIRDEAKTLAPLLGMDKEYTTLNKIISALLSTHTSSILSSDVAKARAQGEPFDANRIQLFEKLFEYLYNNEFPEYPDENKDLTSYCNFAFFESYFSNYIEGTIFSVKDAKEIITTNLPIPTRDEDSHDVLGTYQLVSSRKEMSLCPTSAEQFLDIIRHRHSILLAARTSKNPGQFKTINNSAGNTNFVEWELVTGTLKKGFDLYMMLDTPFSKAAYIMFMISEVHPFLDGNGRIARVMMNAELSSQKRSKIIIPSVYREDYLGGLRKLTKTSDPTVYTRMLLRAYEFSSKVYGTNFDAMEAYLKKCNAFEVDEGIILQF